jgi:AraC family transcriptional regulator, regulatory protein of adaptative response / DNA-3-methyladenine glycosylase II
MALETERLDADACYRAVRSRDRRFEGRFVLAVTSTGIYCRPGCPARTPARRNVRFLPSPAAAEVEGFRACRRCRPDASPDSAAWSGTAATVTRALRLIDEGALDREGVEALGSRLGMSGRHLRRLFLDRLGATPKAVALTRRAHFARKLIEETGLSMAAVASAAGFGSVRRFNGTLRRTFRCAPGELRRRARGPAPGITLRLLYHPPLDWDGLLAFLAARAIPGVEEVEGGRYRRTIRAGAAPGFLEVAPSAGAPALLLTVAAPPGPGLDRMVRRVRRLFDLDADPSRIESDLARDPLLKEAVRAHPGVRVPGAWDGFETMIRAILGQQVSVRGATTLSGRLVAALGDPIPSPDGSLTHLFPTPAAVARADLSRLGIPGARRRCLVEVARSAGSGSLPLDGAASLEDAVARLTALPGIGPWTAQYVAMRALGEPDAFPAGDLVLRRETGLGEEALERRAEAWKPWRAYAAMLLWRRHGESAGTKKTLRSIRRHR